jgi:AcrR family transcriptional regulator
MLTVAAALIRTEGVGALTLARLAIAAGVTKPIAYQHFETREGLLAALYQQLGHHHEQAVATSIAGLPLAETSIEHAAAIIAGAMIDCILENGHSYAAIISALDASPHGAAIGATLRRDIVQAYAKVLQQATGCSQILALGLARALIGAGEALAVAVGEAEMTRNDAVIILTTMLGAAMASQY